MYLYLYSVWLKRFTYQTLRSHSFFHWKLPRTVCFLVRKRKFKLLKHGSTRKQTIAKAWLLTICLQIKLTISYKFFFIKILKYVMLKMKKKIINGIICFTTAKISLYEGYLIEYSFCILICLSINRLSTTSINHVSLNISKNISSLFAILFHCHKKICVRNCCSSQLIKFCFRL